MDTKELAEKLGTAFEEYKKTNDQRIEAIQKDRGTAELDEKLAKMDTVLSDISEKQSELEKKAARPDFGGQAGAEIKSDYSKAYDKFLRKGDDGDLVTLAKSLNITTDAEGGHTVPEELDRMIHDLVIDLSPMRSICNVIQVSSSDYKKLVNVRGTSSGWVGEQTARPETNSPEFEQIAVPIGEIYANAYATQHMLDDAFFDVESFLAGEVATEFAQKEGQAFISGNGTNKPTGFLTGATAATADGARAFGTLQTISTGAAGAFATPTTTVGSADALIDTVYSLKQGHRAGAQWVLNKNTLAEVRKLKDVEGQYIWQPSLQAGQPSSVLGYAVTEMEDMPDVAADSLSIAFGNFKTGYTIADRVGVRALRDPYTAKPFVTYYTTKRVGGKLIDSEAIKLVKFGV